MLMQSFVQVKVNLEKKIRFFPARNFRLLVLARKTIMLQHLIFHISLHYRELVAYGRLKTKGNIKRLALKALEVAYERWSLTRGLVI